MHLASARRERTLPASVRRLAAGVCKPGADAFTVWMTDLVEYGERLAPGPASGIGLTDALPQVAKAAQGICFVVTICPLPVELDGSLVARDRLPVVAEPVANVADAVPGGRFPVPRSQL